MSDQNPFIWQELVTPDQETSGAFYSKLFGWSLKQVDAGEYGMYVIFIKDGKSIAGMMNPTAKTPGEGSYWHSYIGVEDIDECVKQTTQLGGKVIVPAHHIPDEGQVCVIADPTGAIVHLMQAEIK